MKQQVLKEATAVGLGAGQGQSPGGHSAKAPTAAAVQAPINIS